MLIRYAYQLKNGKECGFYQCEKEDFRKFWKAAKSDIRCAVIETGEDVWIYYLKFDQGYWQKASTAQQIAKILDDID